LAIRRKSFVGLVAGLLNAGVALFVAGAVFDWVLTKSWPEPPSPVWPFLLALGILLVNVSYLVLWVKGVFGAGEMRYITTQSEDGVARISVRALRTALKRSARAEPGISSARVRLRREGEDRIRISATVRAEGEQNAVRLAGRVRELLRASFFRVVPDDGSLKLHVVVKVASLGTAGPVEEPAEVDPPVEPEPEDEMFTGPRYPVEDMEGV
jgi:hypothetical protein